MVNTWTGARRIAFIPVSNSEVDVNLPDHFEEQVYRRVYIDPDPVTGVDRSLQAYIQRASSGMAYITGDIFPPVVAPDADVITPGLESLPKLDFPFGLDIPLHGYQYAAMVLPHSSGPHRGGYAWWDNPPINGISNRARVALYTNAAFTDQQPTGVWAMEILHAVTELGDLYNVSPHLGRYDEMACSCGTHPSAHTKGLFGWLRPGAVRTHPVGHPGTYVLHAVSHMQPPPPGRVTAVRVKSQVGPGDLIIEARLRGDDLDGPSAASSGIPDEGVIVYRAQSNTMVFLLASGQVEGDTINIADEDLEIQVSRAVPGGYEITIRSRATNRCRELRQTIEQLQTTLELETDINRRKQIISLLAKARAEYRDLLCDEIPDLWDESVKGRLLGDRIERFGYAGTQPDGPDEYPPSKTT